MRPAADLRRHVVQLWSRTSKRARACSVQQLHRPSISGYRVPPSLGFRPTDYGMSWYPSKDTLLESGPGPVLVGTSYEYQPADSGVPP